MFFTLPDNKTTSFFNSEYIKTYKGAIEKIKNTYLMLNLATLQLDSSSFRNSDHLNTFGSSFVTKKMIALLAKDGYLERAR